MTESTEHSRVASVVDNIRDEVHYAGTGEVFRQRVGLELHAIYGQTNLAQSLRALANSAVRHDALAGTIGSESAARFYPQTIYMGSLLALRAMLHPNLTAKTSRQLFLGQDFYPSDTTVETPQEQQAVVLRHAATARTLLDTCDYHASHADQSLQDVLIDTAASAFSDHSALSVAAEYESRFIIGFYLGALAIVNLSAEVKTILEQEGL